MLALIPTDELKDKVRAVSQLYHFATFHVTL